MEGLTPQERLIERAVEAALFGVGIAFIAGVIGIIGGIVLVVVRGI